MFADLRTVLATAPEEATARSLAEALVAEGLAACVSLVPGVLSIYRWKNEVRHDAEVLLIMKTSAVRVAELQARLAALHPYEVPEVISLVVDDAHPPYAAWVRGETEGRP